MKKKINNLLINNDNCSNSELTEEIDKLQEENNLLKEKIKNEYPIIEDENPFNIIKKYYYDRNNQEININIEEYNQYIDSIFNCNYNNDNDNDNDNITQLIISGMIICLIGSSIIKLI